MRDSLSIENFASEENCDVWKQSLETKSAKFHIRAFRKLVMTVLKTTIFKNKPPEIVYTNYKYFTSQNCNDKLKSFFSKENIDCCRKSNQTFLNVLNKLAPLKKKRLRADHVSYVSTSMRKALFRRSYLENFNFKKRTDKSLKAYKNRKIIAAGFTKRNVKNALTN